MAVILMVLQWQVVHGLLAKEEIGVYFNPTRLNFL